MHSSAATDPDSISTTCPSCATRMRVRELRSGNVVLWCEACRVSAI